MRIDRKRFGILVVAMGLFGCGGSLKGGSGPDGSTGAACSSLGACACRAASDRCTARTEACWCPSECDPQIACICGGGRFLACEDNMVVASCASELAAVQSKCANQAFVQYIADLCTLPPTYMAAASPTCIAGCLANLNNTGSCSEIDCSFCPVCDCVGPATPSPFSACLDACRQAPPPSPNI
jgi:hypothetical protein